MNASDPAEGRDAAAPAVKEDPAAPAPAPPAAPPTRRGTAPRHRRPSVWPTAIGVISVVLGGSAILLGAWTTVALPLMNALMGSLPGMPPMTARVMMLTLASGALTALVAAMLLTAGIMLCRRRASARAWHVRWAVVKLAVAAALVALGVLIQREQMAAAEASAGATGAASSSGAAAQASAAATFAAMGGFMLWFQAIVSLLWYSAYPIFVLIWFHQSSVKDECARWT